MFRLVFVAFFVALLAGVSPAAAQVQPAPTGNVQPLDRILPQIRSRYPGTFYDAEGPYNDGRGSPHYQLKWMTPEGRVIWLDTDARTGRVYGVQRGGRAFAYGGGPPPYARGPGVYPGPVVGPAFGVYGGYRRPAGRFYAPPRAGYGGYWQGRGGRFGGYGRPFGGWGGHFGHHGGH